MTDVAAGKPIPGLMQSRAAQWVRANLFSSWLNTAITLVIAYFLIKVLVAVLSWALFNAVWTVENNNTQACRAVQGMGACWAVIAEKYRFILFGTYPYEQQWRELAAIVTFIALYGISAMRRFWSLRLLYVWIAGLVLIGVVMWGGVFGLPVVETDRWGGLVITLILATFGIAVAFPIGVLLALGRRSDMPAIKTLSVVYIEAIRGVPLVSLLFMASVMLPLFLPEGVNINKLLRAQVAMIMFASAYLAEVVRGGLQAIPKGQYEAASALGLSYWQKTGLIILPQALRLVIPPLVNTFIGLFKDTSLVVIIGIYDLLDAAKTTVNTDPEWRGFGVEAYLFVSIIYFIFCFAMSKYSQHVEADLARARRR
ncbi:MAG TPA: amino acid ABC transporter permease [Alphaproteobacteria bacterium]